MSSPFLTRLNAPLTAKRAALSVLAATERTTLTTAQLTACGELLGIDASATKMALGRLVKNGDVVCPGRGTYAIGDKGQPILHAIRRWADLPNQVRAWRGAWLFVHTAHLGRAARPALRRRERALALFGFAPSVSGLWLRPDNLSEPHDRLHQRMQRVGLDDEAVVVAGEFVARGAAETAWSLWNREELEAGYRDALLAMTRCLETFDDASVAARAEETARIGSAVIGMLTFDPLLPRDLVDADARDHVHAAMLRFDEIGKAALEAYWAERGCG